MALAVPAKRNNLKQHKVCITLNVRPWLTYTTSLHQGRWPEKSVKFITRLLKNAESNADAKNLDVEDLIIKNIVVQQAPVGLPFDSSSPTLIFTCLNDRKLAAVRTVLMVASTPTKVTLAMSKLSSRYLRRKWNEARIRRSQLLHLLALIGDRSQSAALKLHAPEDGGPCVCMYASLYVCFTVHLQEDAHLSLSCFTDCASSTAYGLLNPRRLGVNTIRNISLVFHSTQKITVQHRKETSKT